MSTPAEAAPSTDESLGPSAAAGQAAAGAAIATGPQRDVRHARFATIAIASALFMEFIDSTALSTALPTLSRAFHTDPLHLKLALTSYILALAVVAPASGWVADRFGAKRVFMIAMGVFLAGSVLCGLSTSLTQLVLCRLLQGAGGAMMTPVGRLIIVASTPRAELVSAMSWFTMPALIGPLLGPPIAGFVLGVADWPWIFYLNIPVCAAGLLAVWKLVPPRAEMDPGPFDLRGFVLAAIAISALVSATETIGVHVFSLGVQLTLLAIAIVASLAYVRHARRTPKPVLDLTLFKLPTYRASILGGTLVRLGIGATPLLLPLLLQVALGWSPLKAGLISIWQSFGALSAKWAAPRFLKRFGFKPLLVATVLATGILTAVPGLFGTGTPLAAFIAVFVLSGFARSNQFTAANTISYADVPGPRVSNASALSTVTQQVGLTLGVSFGGAVLALAKGSPGTPLTADRFLLPYLAVGFTTFLALPVYLRLPASAGASLRGEKK